MVYSGFAVNNFAGAAYSGGLAMFNGDGGEYDAIITSNSVASAGDYSASTTIDSGASLAPGGISIAFTPAPGNPIIAIQDFETPGSGIPFSFDGEDTDIGDYTAWGELSDLSGGSPSVAFTGYQGANYVYGQRTGGATKSITLGPVDVSSYTNVMLRLSLAANSGVWESGEADDLVVRLDKDNDGSFETTLVDFIASGTLSHAGYILQTTFIPLYFSLPGDCTEVNLRIDFTTTGDTFEAIGIDNVRFTGRRPVVPAGTVVIIR